MNTSLMKAAIFRQYGPPDVLQVSTVPRPFPNDNQILIRNYASSVNSGDWKLRKADPAAVRFILGLFRPKKSKQIPGTVYAGIVESIGSKVTGFQPGDHVFGMTALALGAHATHVCIGQNTAIAKLSPSIPFTDAAAIPFGATTALYFLRKAGLAKDQDILIYGASGSVGIAAIQLAKHFGARVTAVTSAANEVLVRSQGADFHLDYTHPSFEQHDRQYNVVFETVGKLPCSKALKYVRENGTLVLGSAGFRDLLFAKGTAKRKKKNLVTGLAMEKKEEMEYISRLMSSNVLRPVIEKIYPLEDIAEAHRHAESGHKKGNVVISLTGGL